jgi:type IV pilus assembly protein PilO
MNTHTMATWRERLASPLTRHLIGSALLLLLVIGLTVRMGLDWAATHGSSADAQTNMQVQLKTLELETAPLRGLEGRIEDASGQTESFLSKRIPPSYSAIAVRVGELQVKAGARLSRVQYTQGQAGPYLTEISMDASISGDYPQIMRFVNALEHDQTYFVIRGMALAGQQGGQVNLRLIVSSWLRPADAAASGLPLTPEPGKAAPAAAKEGM